MFLCLLPSGYATESMFKKLPMKGVDQQLSFKGLWWSVMVAGGGEFTCSRNGDTLVGEGDENSPEKQDSHAVVLSF